MKKNLLILAILLFAVTPAMADCEATTCVEPYDLSGGVSKFFSTVTGSNFIGEKVAESAIKKEGKKLANTKFDVNIESFSSADLKAGRFKSLEIEGKDLNYENIYLKSLYAKTLCNFNYVVQDENSKKIIFKEALPLSFNVTVNADNINSILKSTNYQKKIDELNNLQSTFGLIKIKSTAITIKDNKFLYMINLSLPFMKNTQTVTLSSDLTVVDGKIALKDTKLINNGLSLDITKLNYILKYLNPFDYSVNIMENVSAKIQIQNVVIDNDEIVLNGTFVIPKDTIQ